jgi:hypothetical protein
MLAVMTRPLNACSWANPSSRLSGSQPRLTQAQGPAAAFTKPASTISCALSSRPAPAAARLLIRAKPAVVNGDPRSLTKTSRLSGSQPRPVAQAQQAAVSPSQPQPCPARARREVPQWIYRCAGSPSCDSYCRWRQAFGGHRARRLLPSRPANLIPDRDCMISSMNSNGVRPANAARRDLRGLLERGLALVLRALLASTCLDAGCAGLSSKAPGTHAGGSVVS